VTCTCTRHATESRRLPNISPQFHDNHMMGKEQPQIIEEDTKLYYTITSICVPYTLLRLELFLLSSGDKFKTTISKECHADERRVQKNVMAHAVFLRGFLISHKAILHRRPKRVWCQPLGMNFRLSSCPLLPHYTSSEAGFFPRRALFPPISARRSSSLPSSPPLTRSLWFRRQAWPRTSCSGICRGHCHAFSAHRRMVGFN